MRYLSFALLCALSSAATIAQAGTITFEGFADATVLTDQYLNQGILFENAEVIQANYTLNQAEFPPFSGINVATDAYGPVLITFSVPVIRFSGYFTYVTQLGLQGYDQNGDLVPTVSATSAFMANTVSSHSSGLNNFPNERILLGDGYDLFSQIIIDGSSDGSSFVVDDISFDAVPEPATWILAASALAFFTVCRCFTRRLQLRAKFLLIACSAVLPASAQFSASAYPTDLEPNVATNIAFTATFDQPPLPQSVILQEIDASGNIINSSLGLFSMVSPTSYYLNVPLTITTTGMASRFVQVSAGFPGEIERETYPIAFLAGNAPAAAPNFLVTFQDKIVYYKDTNLGQPLLQDSLSYSSSRTINPAVAYYSGQIMRADLTFTANPQLNAPMNADVVGEIQGGCPSQPVKFTTPMQIKVNAGANQTNVRSLTADVPLRDPNQSPLVEFCKPMTIEWSYTIGKNKTVIGTSLNDLFVTLAQPKSKPLGGRMYLTNIFLAASKPGAKLAQDALNNTWSLFSTGGMMPGPADVTTWAGRKLSYYPAAMEKQKAQNFVTCPATEEALLTSKAQAGRCGTFGHLFYGALLANGISISNHASGGQVSVTAKDSSYILVNNWGFPAVGTSGVKGYPFKMVFSKNAQEMVPPPVLGPPAMYGDLTNGVGIAGQNSATPSEKVFLDHAIVLPNKNFDQIYYDPSYGVTYRGPADFELVVAGYSEPVTLMQIARPPKLLNIKQVDHNNPPNNILFTQK